MTPKRVIGSRCLERAQRLAVLPEQLVEQAPAGRIGERLEHLVHGAHYM